MGGERVRERKGRERVQKLERKRGQKTHPVFVPSLFLVGTLGAPRRAGIIMSAEYNRIRGQDRSTLNLLWIGEPRAKTEPYSCAYIASYACCGFL